MNPAYLEKYWHEHPQEWERELARREMAAELERQKAEHQAEVQARKEARMAKTKAKQEALHHIHLHRTASCQSGRFPVFGTKWTSKGSRWWQQEQKRRHQEWKDSQK